MENSSSRGPNFTNTLALYDTADQLEDIDFSWFDNSLSKVIMKQIKGIITFARSRMASNIVFGLIKPISSLPSSKCFVGD